MQGTTWGYNHYNSGRADSAGFIDYIFAHNKFKVPIVNYNETQAYRLNITNKPFWGVFDLGDHQPVYSRMEFPTIASEISDNTVCPGDNFEIVLSTSLSDYTVEWYKDGVLMFDEQSLVLSRNDITESDWGQYEGYILYQYQSDTVINSTPTHHPEYIPQGPTQGRLYQSFLVGPDEAICGIVSSTVDQLNLPFSVYPNPAKQNITLDVNGWVGNFEIYNSAGKLMKNGKVASKSILNIQDWAAGTYTLQMFLEGKRYSYSFIKQ